MRTTPRTSFEGTAGTTWRSTRTRLVVSVVRGGRTGESVRELVTDVKERFGVRPPELITTRRVYGL